MSCHSCFADDPANNQDLDSMDATESFQPCFVCLGMFGEREELQRVECRGKCNRAFHTDCVRIAGLGRRTQPMTLFQCADCLQLQDDTVDDGKDEMTADFPVTVCLLQDRPFSAIQDYLLALLHSARLLAIRIKKPAPDDSLLSSVMCAGSVASDVCHSLLECKIRMRRMEEQPRFTSYCESLAKGMLARSDLTEMLKHLPTKQEEKHGVSDCTAREAWKVLLDYVITLDLGDAAMRRQTDLHRTIFRDLSFSRKQFVTENVILNLLLTNLGSAHELDLRLFLIDSQEDVMHSTVLSMLYRGILSEGWKSRCPFFFFKNAVLRLHTGFVNLITGLPKTGIGKFLKACGDNCSLGTRDVPFWLQAAVHGSNDGRVELDFCFSSIDDQPVTAWDRGLPRLPDISFKTTSDQSLFETTLKTTEKEFMPLWHRTVAKSSCALAWTCPDNVSDCLHVLRADLSENLWAAHEKMFQIVLDAGETGILKVALWERMVETGNNIQEYPGLLCRLLDRALVVISGIVEIVYVASSAAYSSYYIDKVTGRNVRPVPWMNFGDGKVNQKILATYLSLILSVIWECDKVSLEDLIRKLQPFIPGRTVLEGVIVLTELCLVGKFRLVSSESKMTFTRVSQDVEWMDDGDLKLIYLSCESVSRWESMTKFSLLYRMSGSI